MLRVTSDRPWPLYQIAAIRRIEERATAALPAHTLMQRAGLAIARLALALAPHGRSFWVACGPGNNGGDGFEAALHLKRWGKEPVITWLGNEDKAPADALRSLKRARDAGVRFAPQPPEHFDYALDALLGIGSARIPDGALRAQIERLAAEPARVLAVDLPSGLDADSGSGTVTVRAAHTLGLLALKPGLFTANGRDAAGAVWFDDLGVGGEGEPTRVALSGPPLRLQRPHASHKGTHGDVAVVGGAAGMAGAVLLAARAALHHGAGRVFAAFLDPSAPPLDASQPDLMVRRPDSLDFRGMAVACGCGGGEAVRSVLPKVLARARALVLDADALNAIAADARLQALLLGRAEPTVLTPHPLEAARLLGSGTAQVQAERLQAARSLAARFRCIVLLKGSGTVIATPAGEVRINPTGNARLAIAGTGDVLAGMVAARLANGEDPFAAATHAVYLHGLAADRWSPDRPLTAAALAAAGD